jgi:pimeloyl-ACP methyl ester carboxylesterase
MATGRVRVNIEVQSMIKSNSLNMSTKLKAFAIGFCLLGFALTANAQAVAEKLKAPIIIIPGLTGSELVNGETDELVWFTRRRSKQDDLRLPITPNLARNRDKLVPRDIIRGVQLIKFLPEVEIYSQLITALEKRAGYVEGDWEKPEKGGFEATFYVFPYDWRRDNIENARLLIQKIESLKAKLGKPDLRFNIVAHSMGGLISRYAAMYGNNDVGAGKPKPNWSGAKHLDKIFLLGTPNEGAISALDAMLNGFSYFGRGVNLPFFRDFSRFDVFTLPSMFQLMPHGGSLKVYDENLKSLKIDLYEPKTWDAYGWNIWNDGDFKDDFDIIEQENARPYFRAVLERARQFQTALSVSTNGTPPVRFYLIGADCRETLDGAILLKTKKGRWRMIFRAESFERTNGEKVSSEDVRKTIFAMGDGVVPQSSLKAQNTGGPKTLPVTAEIYHCESHGRLVTNPEIQDRLFVLLFGDAAIK